MAGKKRTGEAVAGAPKAKAKAKSKLPVADEADPAPPQPAAVVGNAASAAVAVNGEVMKLHLDNVKLFSQAVGSDVLAMAPRKQEMLTPFDEAKALTALKSEGEYFCAMSMTWLDHSWSPCPQVPLNKGAVSKIREFFFAGPTSFSRTKLVVAVLRAEVDGQRMPPPGMWKRISLEESLIAFYQEAASVAQKALEGSTQAEQEVTKWLNYVFGHAM